MSMPAGRTPIELPTGTGKSDVLKLLKLKKRTESPAKSEAPDAAAWRKMVEWRADLLHRIEQGAKDLVEGLARERADQSGRGGSRKRRIRALTLEIDELRWQNTELKQYVIAVGSLL